MRALTLIFLLLYLTAVPGQGTLDSLQSLLAQSDLSTKARVDALNGLGYEYWIMDTEKSVQYGKEALALADRMDYDAEADMSKRIIGVDHWAQGTPKKALENLTQAIADYERMGDDTGLANCYLNTGMVYADIQDYKKASNLYDKALVKFTALDLKGRSATTYTKMADILFEQNSLYDAKRFLDNALAIHSQNNFTYGMGEVHNRLGRLFIEEGALEPAEYHIRQATILSMKLGDVDGNISNLVLFGKLLRLQENFDASQIHLDLALSEADKKKLKKHQLAALGE